MNFNVTEKLVSSDEVLERITPGMSIFLGTGVAEQRSLIPGHIESGAMYPFDLSFSQTWKDGLTVNFRAIKPSDEEKMRRLFYRFPDHTVNK